MSKVFLVVCEADQVAQVLAQAGFQNPTVISHTPQSVAMSMPNNQRATSPIPQHVAEMPTTTATEIIAKENAVYSEQTPTPQPAAAEPTKQRKPRKSNKTEAPDQAAQAPADPTQPPQVQPAPSDDLFGGLQNDGPTHAPVAAAPANNLPPTGDEFSNLFAPAETAPVPPAEGISQAEFDAKIKQLFYANKDRGAATILAQILKRNDLSRVDNVPPEKRKVIIDMFEHVIKTLPEANANATGTQAR